MLLRLLTSILISRQVGFAGLILLFFFTTQPIANAQTCTGNAVSVTSQTGVTNPNNALGAPNTLAAEMYDNGDVIVLDLNVYLESGAGYFITWRKNSGGTNPSMLIEESYDGVTFTANGAAATVSSTTYGVTTKSVNIGLMRYLRITSQNNGDLDMDGVSFTNQPCSNCNISIVSATPSACVNSRYNLAVTVNYTDPPGGTIVLVIGEGPGTLYTFTPDGTSPDTYTITNLPANGVQDINVGAYFANHPACTTTLVDAYDAPASCGNYCSGNLLLNPSFEITSANVTPPPTGVDYTPASWVAPARAYADYGWLRPDGIAHIGLYGTGNSVAYQNVPVTVGNSYTLTFYSAMHFPLTNLGTAKIQYYNASNVPIGVGNQHIVTHDWEDNNGFGGPYILFLGAAPANASYLRVTLENHNPTAAGESVKFDALCLTASSCVATGCDVVVSPIRIVGRQNNTSPDAEGRVFQRYDTYDLPCWQSGGGGSITNTNTGAPNGTSNQEVYQYGVYQDLLDWHFAVPDGSYTVLLHYSENTMTAVNQRKFDVIIEDVQVENDFDIFAQAGAQSKALVKSYTTTVTDGDLNLRFEKVVDRPLIQGVEIIPNFCTATQSVSLSVVNASSCYLNSSGQSKSTVSVEVAWDNALARDSIRVTLGAQTKWIYPGQYYNGVIAGTIMSPQVVAFEVDANGAAGTVTATMFNNNDCSATANFTAPAACPATTCTSGQLGGTVFNDYDADGVKDAGETFGTPGVIVTVFDCNGNTATTTTDADGKWTISTSLTYPVRVEYSNLPAYVGANGTPNGTDGRTTVQFINTADCSVDLGVLSPSDYCQTTPDIFLPCFVNGDPLPGGSNAGTYDAFIRLTYGATGLSPAITHVASASQVGTLWGVAYDKKRNKVYSSAVLRRHTGLGPLGLGGIYQVNPTTNATSTFVDVQGTLGINVGGLAGGPFFGVTNTSRGLSTNPLTPTHDSLAFAQIGKIGIGDLDISENSDFLYFVNLYDKKLYKLDITGASPTLAASYTIPSACSNGTSRPFALKVKNGVVYVGVVCDGSTAENRSDLRAYVYGLSESSGTFSTIFDFPLTYPKGYPLEGLYHMGNWRTWTDDFDKINMQYTFGSSLCAYPQPILSDIETDIDGSLILGFADRSAFQMGWVNYSPKSSDLSTYNVYSGGDILRAAYKNGKYILENNAYVGGLTGAGPNNNQGPGFGEFYSDNYYDAGVLIHSEIAFGALALKPGSGQTIFTVQDPIDNNGNSAGFRYISNTTGLSPSGTSAGARVYVSNGIGVTFGKAVGLGDLELNCGSVSYLQIGNYVWNDTDKDGVQDACENPIQGVSVSLYKIVSGNPVFVAVTTTGANGEYYFTGLGAPGETWVSTSGTDSVLANTDYKIVFGYNGQTSTSQYASGMLTVSGNDYFLTTANTGQGANPDINDSDAALMSIAGGSYPSINVTTGSLGSVNHTLDAGFWFCPDITSPSATQTICQGSAGSNITVQTTTNAANSIRFVRFTTNQTAINGSETPAELAAIYSGGTVVTTVTPTGGSSPYTATLTTGAAGWNALAPGTYYIYAILNPDLGASCRPVQEIVVTVVAQANAGADGSTSICDNSVAVIDLFSLITGEQAGGTWTRTTGTGGTFNAGAGTFTPAAGATTSTFTYTVTGTSPCPNDASVATVNISAQANSGADGSTSICDNSVSLIDLFSLITGEQSGGVWTRTTGTGGTFNAAAGTFTPVAGATTSTFTYTVTGTSPCPNDASVATVNISAQANAGADGSTSICDNSVSLIDLFSLITGEQAGGTWTRTTGTGGTFNAGAGTFTPAAGATTSTFTYTVTGTSPCPNDASVATVNITPQANAGADGSTSVCDNSVSVINLFSLITGEQAGGTWTRTTGTGGTFNAAAGTFTPAAGATTSTFTYTVTGTAPCPNDASVATVNISAQANAGADGSTSICDNSVSLIDLFSLITGEQSGGVWTRTTGTGGTFNAGAGTFTPAAGATTSTFTYTVTGTAPCPDDASVATVNITAQAANAVFSQVPPSCFGTMSQNDGSITLTSVSNGTHYGFSTLNAGTYNGPAFASATAISLPQVVATGVPNTGGTYIVRVFNGSATCYTDFPVTVTPVNCVALCANPTALVWLVDEDEDTPGHLHLWSFGDYDNPTTTAIDYGRLKYMHPTLGAQDIGDAGDMEAFAVNPATGVAYFLSASRVTNGPSNTQALFSYDLNNAAANANNIVFNLIGHINRPNGVAMECLAFNPVDGKLYTGNDTDDNNNNSTVADNLHVIDLSTLNVNPMLATASTLIGPITGLGEANNYVDGAEFVPNGAGGFNLYLVDGTDDELYQVNPATGAIIGLADLNINGGLAGSVDVETIVWDPIDNVLIGTDNSSSHRFVEITLGSNGGNVARGAFLPGTPGLPSDADFEGSAIYVSCGCVPVTAGTDGSTSICDNSVSVIDLFSLITGEQAGGVWTRTTGTGGTFNAGAGTFTPAA
ncbi:MAG: hypothetical protein JNM22_22010, partial [Saprospiraceae bacterium]|nr:hypothetical protein [Saprospiraceae bacterium]